MKIITFTGYKGGVAKSTSAIHLATFFSALPEGKGKTLVVDGDRNRTCLEWASNGLLPFNVADEKAALKIISGYEYVVIDTAAQPTTEDLQTLAGGCDLLILPTKPDVMSLRPMLQTSNDLNGCQYRALITIAPTYPSTDGQKLKEDLKGHGIPVFETIIRQSVSISKAALAGKPLRDMPAKQRLVWLDYQAFGKEVINLLNQE